MRSWLILIIVATAGCGAKHQVMSSPPGSDSPALKDALSSPDTITFQTVRDLVFEKHCLDCHDSERKKDGIDLTHYGSSLQAGDRKLVEPFNAPASPLYTALFATGKRQMPPQDRAPLSEEQKQLVYFWIQNGAKDSGTDKVERPPTLKEELRPYFRHPEKIDYTLVRKYVIGYACTKCHSLKGESPDRDAITYSANLTDYASLFNPFTPVVTKGNPETSKIYHAAAVTQSMPPAKKGYDPLDSLRLKLLRLWILNCAIEDFSVVQNDPLIPNPENPEKVRDCAR
ncbi:MAG: c-type cytochrome domain-containing protein [Bdellovibrionales bacterium]